MSINQVAYNLAFKTNDLSKVLGGELVANFVILKESDFPAMRKVPRDVKGYLEARYCITNLFPSAVTELGPNYGYREDLRMIGSWMTFPTYTFTVACSFDEAQTIKPEEYLFGSFFWTNGKNAYPSHMFHKSTPEHPDGLPNSCFMSGTNPTPYGIAAGAGVSGTISGESVSITPTIQIVVNNNGDATLTLGNSFEEQQKIFGYKENGGAQMEATVRAKVVGATDWRPMEGTGFGPCDITEASELPTWVISREQQTQTLPEITALEEEGKSAAVVFTVVFTPANEGR